MNALQAHLADYDWLYAPGVLRPEVHHDLVLELEDICRTANVRQEWVAQSMAGICSPLEMDWVRNLPSHSRNGVAGLVYVGTENVEDRMSAMCGALLRNYRDARIMTVQRLVKADEVPMCEVLLCPNLCLSKSAEGHLATWEISTLFGMLVERFNAGLLTVVYVADLETLGVQYGVAFKAHITQKYNLITT